MKEETSLKKNVLIIVFGGFGVLLGPILLKIGMDKDIKTLAFIGLSITCLGIGLSLFYLVYRWVGIFKVLFKKPEKSNEKLDNGSKDEKVPDFK